MLLFLVQLSTLSIKLLELLSMLLFSTDFTKQKIQMIPAFGSKQNFKAVPKEGRKS